MELFKGMGGLSRQVHVRAICTLTVGTVEVLSRAGGPFDDINVADDEDFTKILGANALWVHGAPPCGTFTVARRDDEFAKIKKLRTSERPEGFGCARTAMANKLALRMQEVALQQIKRKQYFSIENPYGSLMWQLRPMIRLAAMPDVRLVRLHQCMYGSLHAKETGVLTNAPWLQDRLCDKEVRPHHHVPLRGLVQDYRCAQGKEVWLTELAAEYPTGLCHEWAQQFVDFVSQQPPAAGHTAAGQAGTDPAQLMRGNALPTAKAQREKENLEAIGGLRNPNRAAARSQPLRKTGARIRQVIEKLGEDVTFRAHVIRTASGLGQPGSEGFDEASTHRLRQALREEFKAKPEDCEAIYDYELWKALLDDAQDPEVEVPEWLAHGAPNGIGPSEIKACGIFPRISTTSAAIESAKEFARTLEVNGWSQEKHRNYKSFYEDGATHADAEVKRITEKGFVEVFASWGEVLARWPNAKASKVAVLTKERPDGTTKARLIIDLLRSGVNGEVKLPERVVLPRLSDLVDSMLDLMECDMGRQTPTQDMYEFATVDFEDAFHTVHLQEGDREIAIFKTSTGWAVFSRLCCGMAAAPLVWCRIGAAACRLGQAIYKPDELRVQCFVDDPAVALRGLPAQRSWHLGTLLLFWRALGFKFSWKKGARGTEVPWIGATVSVVWKTYGAGSTVYPGTLVALQPAKYAELQQGVEAIHKAKGMIDFKCVQRVAGQLSWASGMFRWIRGFNACLWAAMTAHTADPAQYRKKFTDKKRPTHLFFVVRIAQAIAWIRMLLAGVVRDRDGQAFRVQKYTSVATRAQDLVWCIRTDASPFGMGAILFKRGRPVAWIAEDWSEHDLRVLKATMGDPAWQAEWELFAVLIAVDTWLPRLHSQAASLLQTDATAALYDATRMAGRTPAMNALAAELALRFESAQVHMAPEHVSGTLNFACDALSRLSKGAKIPAALAGVARVTPRPRLPAFFWAWPRTLLEQSSAASAPTQLGQGA